MFAKRTKRTFAAVTAAAVLGTLPAGVLAGEPAEEYWFLQGYTDGQLHLERTLTRAEFAKMIADAFRLEEAEEKSFADLDARHWSYPYVMKVVEAGAIHGYEDGTFRPEEAITFEQAAKITSAMVSNDWNLELKAGVASAIDYGISDGVQARIGESVTRGEAAQMIAKALQIQQEEEEESARQLQAIEEWLKEQEANKPDTDGEMQIQGGAPGGAPSGSKDFTDDGNRNYDASEGSAPSYSGSGSGSSSGGGGGFTYVPPRPVKPYWNESYADTEENIFKDVHTSPFSTFSIDTDTASYSNMRRFLLNGRMPEKGAIRTEELINYFDYDYPVPEGEHPFGISAELGQCPWNAENQLVRIAVQGEELSREERQPSNLIFLVDVSGSMGARNKLPLVQKALRMLVETMDERDHVSIVTYASGTQVVLPSTNAGEKEVIHRAIDRLRSGGGTYGSAGIQLAYAEAEKNRIDGNNRVIVCSDGDFNIGLTSQGELTDLIEAERDKGIFISTLGFGMGNYKDTTMELLADKGNGNYAYIDNLKEAKKVLVDEMTKTLYTIAKDVKLQVEFNPEKVASYRLVGYENRMLQTEDFADDQKDAGELGAGANVTALYEIVPAGNGGGSSTRYTETTVSGSDELLCVSLRYKEPEGTESQLIEYPVAPGVAAEMSTDFKFVSALAELGMILNDSAYKGTSTLESALALAEEGRGEDPYGLKGECVQLIDLLGYIQLGEDW